MTGKDTVKQSRKKSTIYNSIWAMSTYIIVFVLGLISRKLFLERLDPNILGYRGIFANVFSLLNITEMGVGTVVSYGLYRELANHNENEIAKLMMIYKWMYRFIGFIVTIAGLIFIPFIKNIINDSSGAVVWRDVYAIYGIQLTGTIGTYFLSFRRLLYVCDQKNYVVLKIDAVINVFASLVKIAAVTISESWVVYIACDTISIIVANIIISVKCNKEYFYARHANITLADFKQIEFFKDISFYSAIRIANAIYGGIDNIVVSKILNVSSVVTLTNYRTIEHQVSNLLDKIMTGLSASIGNLVYDSEEKKQGYMFDILSLYGYFVASFVAVCYSVLFQPFIILWVGEIYLLPYSFVILFALNQYITYNHRIIIYFRGTVGKYEQEVIYNIAATLLNLVLSVVLTVKIGITGVIIGTVVSHLLLWIGRANVMFKNVLKRQSIKKYWVKETKRFVILMIQMIFVSRLTGNISNSLFGFFTRGLFCVIIVLGSDFALYRKDEGIMFLNAMIKQLIHKSK